VNGTWQQGAEEQGCFTSGSYSTATGTLVLYYYQPWNNATGTATFRMNSQGTQLSGQYSQSNGSNGSWTMTRSSPSALPAPQTSPSGG
jgi:hypothetical protein